jgi:hypothetical protein
MLCSLWRMEVASQTDQGFSYRLSQEGGKKLSSISWGCIPISSDSGSMAETIILNPAGGTCDPRYFTT